MYYENVLGVTKHTIFKNHPFFEIYTDDGQRQGILQNEVWTLP